MEIRIRIDERQPITDTKNWVISVNILYLAKVPLALPKHAFCLQNITCLTKRAENLKICYGQFMLRGLEGEMKRISTVLITF